MRKTPTVATGVAIAAGGLMAAALVTPTLSASADGPSGERADRKHNETSRMLTSLSCNGGASKAVRNSGLGDGTFSVPPAGRVSLPGTMKLKGPKKGKDVVSVAVTADIGLGSAGAANVDVLVDGKPLKPSTLTTPVILAEGAANTHTAGAAQFCGKIGKGRHNVRIRFSDFPGGSGWHMHSVVAHVEQNN